MSAPVWWLPDGWTTAHVLRDDVLPNTTLCNREVGDRPMTRTEPGQVKRCGQCLRRDPFSATTNGVSA